MGGWMTAMAGMAVVLWKGASLFFGAMAVLVLGLLYVMWRSPAGEDEEIREWTGEDNELKGCTFIDGEED